MSQLCKHVANEDFVPRFQLCELVAETFDLAPTLFIPHLPFGSDVDSVLGPSRGEHVCSDHILYVRLRDFPRARTAPRILCGTILHYHVFPVRPRTSCSRSGTFHVSRSSDDLRRRLVGLITSFAPVPKMGSKSSKPRRLPTSGSRWGTDVQPRTARYRHRHSSIQRGRPAEARWRDGPILLWRLMIVFNSAT